MNTTEKAAAWWADQLRGPAKQDVGYESGTMLRAFLAFGKEPIDEERIVAFQAARTKAIDAARDQWGECTVSVDYNADDTLEDAGDAAGIDLRLRLPAKTVMWITPARVQVRCGYGADVVDL
jgi:hypothetical protein